VTENQNQFNRAYEQFNAARDAYKATGDDVYLTEAFEAYQQIVLLAGIIAQEDARMAVA
jgi:hypothetical protein